MGYNREQILSMYNTRMRQIATNIQRDEDEQDAIAYNELLDKQKRNADLSAVLTGAKFAKTVREGIISRKMDETINEVVGGTLAKKYKYKEGTTLADYNPFGKGGILAPLKAAGKDIGRFIDPLEETEEYKEYQAGQEDIKEFTEETGQEYTPGAFKEWKETGVSEEIPKTDEDLYLTEGVSEERAEESLELLPGEEQDVSVEEDFGEDILEPTEKSLAIEKFKEATGQEYTEEAFTQWKELTEGVSEESKAQIAEDLYYTEGVSEQRAEESLGFLPGEEQGVSVEEDLDITEEEKSKKMLESMRLGADQPIPIEDIESEFGVEGGFEGGIEGYEATAAKKAELEATSAKATDETPAFLKDPITELKPPAKAPTIEELRSIQPKVETPDEKLSAIVPDAETPADIVPDVKTDILKTGKDIYGKSQEVLGAVGQLKTLTGEGTDEEKAIAGTQLASTAAQKVGGKLTEKAIEEGTAKIAEKTGEVVATKAGEKIAGKGLSFAGKALGAGVGVYTGLKTAFSEEATEEQRWGGGLQALGSGLMMTGVGAGLGAILAGGGALLSMFGGGKQKAAAPQKRKFDVGSYQQRSRNRRRF